MFREKRKEVVDVAEKLLRKTGLTDKTICTILRTLHFGITLITVSILLFGSKRWVLIVLFFNILVYILFYLYEGCILSSLEHRFTKEEFTVIDPFITFFNAELTHENRYTYSIYSSMLGFSLTIVIYYMRFMYGAKTEDITML